MIKHHTGKPNKKAIANITSIISSISDDYSDFYYTKDNMRIFLRENIEALYQGLSLGDHIAYDDNGVALVIGYSDNSNRKYLKVLATDQPSASSLIQIVLWHVKETLWAKVKKTNPLCETLLANGFAMFGSRGREVLYCRDPFKQ